MPVKIDYDELQNRVLDNCDIKYPDDKFDSMFKSLYKVSVVAAVDVLYELSKMKYEESD